MKRYDFAIGSGSGNSFVLVWCEEKYIEYNFVSSFWENNEKFGKPDGLILLLPPDNKGDIKMRVFNPDGKETPMCLNGIRCVARFFCERKMNKPEVCVETDLGNIIVSKCEDNEYQVKHISGISFTKFKNLDTYTARIVELDANLKFSFVTVYTPYILTLVDVIDEEVLEMIGQKANTMKALFPIGINVSFIKKLSDCNLYVRTFERGGIGLSLSCSSSMVAAAYLMVMSEEISPNLEIKIYNKGGIVKVMIEKEGDLVSANLIGDTVFECKGILKYDSITQNFEICETDKFSDGFFNAKKVKKLRDECGEKSFLICK